MTKIVADANLLRQLHNLSQPLELCDESGRVLGHVFPVLDLSEYELSEPPMSEEELCRREQESDSSSTAEVLGYLETLPCSKSDGNGPQ